jgi:hypothetical protein
MIDRQQDIAFGHQLHQAVIVRLGSGNRLFMCCDRRSNLFQKSCQMLQADAVAGSFDCAAMGVSQHNDEFGAGQSAGNFHTSQDIVVEDVARHPGAEDIA